MEESMDTIEKKIRDLEQLKKELEEAQKGMDYYAV